MHGFLAHLIHGFVDPGFKLSLTVSQLIAGLFGLIAALWLQDRNQAPLGIAPQDVHLATPGAPARRTVATARDDNPIDGSDETHVLET